MSGPRGRGRGVSNEPAWMSKQRAENGGPGPGGGEGGGGGPPGGGGGGGGGGPPPPRRSRSRSRDRDRHRDGDPDTFGRVRSDARGGGGGPPPRDGGRYGPPGGGGGGGRGYDRRDSRGRGRSPPRGGGGGRGGGGRGPPGGGGGQGSRRDGIYFRSYEEERAWVEDRRRRRRERKSQFDVEPTPEQLEMERAEEAAKAALAAGGAMPGAAPDGSGGGGGVPRKSRLPVSSQPQQTRHARRLYVGHLPPDLAEEQVHAFFRDSIARAMGHDSGSAIDDPILSVYVNPERRFAFIEFKTMEVCTASLALDGINVLGRGKVKVKRPNDYNPALAPEPNPAVLPRFDVSNLGIVSGSVPDGPNKIFIGGLPYHLTEENVVELLGAFGAVRAFHLVKADPTATTNKGYGFVEYVDAAVTPIAIMGLNGMDMGGGKQISARMAAARGEAPGGGAAPSLQTGMLPQPGAVPGGVPGAAAAAPIPGSVDVEALLNAALGGAPAAPIPAAPVAANPMAAYQPPLQQQQQQQQLQPPPAAAVSQIADAALDAAFGTSSGGGAAPPSAAAVPAPTTQTMTVPPGAVPYQQQQPTAAAASLLAPPPPPPPPAQVQTKTRILVLLNMVTDEDLATDDEYGALVDEVKEECEKYGRLLSIRVPRPRDGYAPTAVKKIFLEYATVDDAGRAEGELAGRQFGPNVVEATYFPEEEYAGGRLM